MPLAIVGCDFRVASAQWRNLLLPSDLERANLALALRDAAGVTGLVAVETCNRVEWLASTPMPQWAGEVMRAQMLDRWMRAGVDPLPRIDQMPKPYLYCGHAAVRHLLRVAVGLESFVVGEREIAGQLNRSLAAARLAGQGSPFHNALQTAVGRTVKKVQRLTEWRHHGRGVHSLALQVVRQHLDELTQGEFKATVVVVGMGEIGRKIAGLLTVHGKCRVVRVNRTVADERRGEWRPLAHLPELLLTADAVVVATGARDPIVDFATLQLPVRAKPTLIVDLGAPAQVCGHGQPHLAYRGLDDLLALPTVAPTEIESSHVLDLVEEGLREFVLECRKRDWSGLLRAVHDSYESASYTQLPLALATELGANPENLARVQEVMRDLLRNLTREIVQHIETAANDRTRPSNRRGP
ncbi:MAG: hypothetical protein EXR77_07800 [Myxococcales bacterium]|nr:hypothetical protein [Myxococcales bacterium]